MTTNSDSQKTNLLFLSLSALGIVFGDLGTSPLYATSRPTASSNWGRAWSCSLMSRGAL
jgi:K+ transporter